MNPSGEQKKQEALDFVEAHLRVAEQEQSYGTIQISIQAGVPEMASVKWLNRLGNFTDANK